MNPLSSTLATAGPPGWSSAGRFLEALSRRDFPAVGRCVEPNVRFRALVPPGPFELSGASALVERFAQWFDGPDEFELVDASIGQVGRRLYLRWRVRMVAVEPPHPARIVEQHAFVSGDDTLGEIDLLCSGFHPEAVSSGATAGTS